MKSIKSKNITKTTNSQNKPNIQTHEYDNINIEINQDFFYYKKLVYQNTPKNRYPTKVSYGGKNYYMMTKPDYIINNKLNDIIYYCSNYRIKTTNKKFTI